MKIERIAEFALDADTADGIGALLAAVFGGDVEGRNLLTRHHMRLLLREGDRIIGHLALGLRVIRLGDRLVDIVTVAEVATAQDRRGEGIASALLAEAVDAARGTGAAFMILFGTAGLYGAAGFRKHANQTRWVDMRGRRTGAVIDELASDLLVLSLGQPEWSDADRVDLLGPKF